MALKSENSGGDSKTQGGVLVYHRDGTLKYACYEEFGKPLPIQEIEEAIYGFRPSLLASSAYSQTSASASVSSWGED